MTLESCLYKARFVVQASSVIRNKVITSWFISHSKDFCGLVCGSLFETLVITPTLYRNDDVINYDS